MCRVVIACVAVLSLGSAQAAEPDARVGEFGLAIHGGAGTITPDKLTPERERAYRAALTEALRAGHAVLRDGGEALDAVITAIRLLEDSPLFNAGKGAVFTHDGRNELDAAIMDGRTGNAGAVAGLTRIRNPILLARTVMQHSPHVLLIGEGAEAFADEQGFTFVDPKYFFTQERWEQLRRILGDEDTSRARRPDDRFGTVGAVALDRRGNLAAGTSTGGLTDKRFGRVGDVPIIGAGTYADNVTCAVSATGHGEYFIRSVVAHDISRLIAYRAMPLADAAHHVVMEKLVERGGSGGVIAINRAGEVALPFNTAGMYRGFVRADGTLAVRIYRD